MYVIYPAEEIITLTYALPVQRSRPRPTLDNLKEPRVPPPHQPSSLLSNNANHRLSATAATIDPDEFSRDGYDDYTSSRNDLDNTNYSSVYSSQSRLSPHVLAQKPPPMAIKVAAPKKSKLAKLAKLGRPHSTPVPETNESARVSEYHDIVVSNPTFTRANLHARNFDAFFESGEPVYSIETKERPTPNSAEILDMSMPPPLPPPLPPLPPQPPKSKFNFLKRNNNNNNNKDKPQPLMTEFEAGARSRRGSHSSDILLIVEDPQKGDRCTPLMIFECS